MVMTQIGASQPPSVTLIEDDLSVVTMQEIASVLAIATLQDMYSGNLPRSAFLTEKSKELVDMLIAGFLHHRFMAPCGCGDSR